MSPIKRYCFYLSLLSLLVFSFALPKKASAQPQARQEITSANQLIDAVNGLRLAYGLPTLAVHAVLMQTAQSQADYMAATGQVTHARPGGITYTQQLLSLGFPLSGNLSLGGFRAENILSSYNPLVWNGVPPAWQDADHMNTMLSQNFTHIGAGVSQGPDGYYYAVDAAAATGSGQMQSDAPAILGVAPGSETVVDGSSAISQYMVPVMISTARPSGEVVHKVQYGQTLWSIAIEYDTTIKGIQALNGLGEDLVVYQGQELIVKTGATQPAPLFPTPTTQPGFTPTTIATYEIVTPAMIFPFTPVQAPTLTEEPVSTQSSPASSSILIAVLIIAVAVGAGMAAWLIRDPN